MSESKSKDKNQGQQGDQTPAPTAPVTAAVEVPAGLNQKARQIEMSGEKARELQAKGKLAGYDEKKGLGWVIPVVLLAFSMIFGATAARATASSSAEGVLGNDRFEVQNDGDLVPLTDSSFDIGADGSEVANVYVDNVIADGDVNGDGGDQFYGFLQDQVASTTTTITAAQAGKTFVSNSADVMTLPEASTVLGARYTFICGTADDFDINPADATDQFAACTASGGTIDGAAGDAYRITDIGSSITVEAIGADVWAVIAHNGAVTDVD